MPASPRLPDTIAATIVDPKAYATDEIHEAYAWLRANMPLGVAHAEGYDPFWVVSRYEDLQTISKDNTLFPYGDRAATLTNIVTDRRVREITGTPHLIRTLVQMDEPDHMKYRLLTQAWFMPASVKKRQADVLAIARKSVARMADKGGACDFVADVALNYPLEVVMNILGVPEDDFPLMLRLTQEIFGAQDEETARFMEALDASQYAEIMATVVEDFAKYFAALSEDRRARPRDDLATIIANATVDGVPIGIEESTGYYTIVATAGHDTTSSSTSGGMWALATQPGLLDRLKAEPQRIADFVEESIRWTSPVRTFMRSAAKDTQVGGQSIGAGDWLMLCYGSANRDEAVFEDPFRFRIDRGANKQIAFGYGPHMCLGMHLARMEMKILWEEMIPRLKSVRLAGEPAAMASTFVTGLKRLPIEYDMV